MDIAFFTDFTSASEMPFCPLRSHGKIGDCEQSSETQAQWFIFAINSSESYVFSSVDQLMFHHVKTKHVVFSWSNRGLLLQKTLTQIKEVHIRWLPKILKEVQILPAGYWTTVVDLGEGPGGPGPLPLFWVKKKKWLKGKRPAGQVNQDCPPPSPRPP